MIHGEHFGLVTRCSFVPTSLRNLLPTLVVVGVIGCASARQTMSLASIIDGDRNENAPCVACAMTVVALAPVAPAAIDSVMTRAIESRVAELKARGGFCSEYGAVLESSFRNGKITIRPYMWRVGSHLASGEAKPNGDMVLAREIDSLNVGARTLDDLLWTMEHESAHIAFKIDTQGGITEDRADDYVRACRQVDR